MSGKSVIFKKSVFSTGFLIFLVITLLTVGCCSKQQTETGKIKGIVVTKPTETNEKDSNSIKGIVVTPPELNEDLEEDVNNNPSETAIDLGIPEITDEETREFVEDLKSDETSEELLPAPIPTETKKLPTIGFMISPKGLNDKGFNDSAYQGLNEAEEKLELETVIIEPNTLEDNEASLKFFAKQKFDAIIALGDLTSTVQEIAKDHPETNFYIIDSSSNVGNVRGIAFRDGEGAFLCGYLAGKMTKSKHVGFIGGLPCAVMDRFYIGFANGVKLADPNIKITEKYIAKDFSGYNDDVKGKAIADEMYKSGIDVIFPPCGGSALGVFDSAEENKKFVFGVDSNQDYLVPDLILTSLIKRVDKAVFYVCKSVCDGTQDKLNNSYGIAEDAIGLTDFEYSKDIIGDSLINELKNLKEQIKNGQIDCMKALK